MAPRVLFVVVGVAAFVVACDKSGPSPAPAPSTMPDQSVTSSAPATADAPAVMAQSGGQHGQSCAHCHRLLAVASVTAPAIGLASGGARPSPVEPGSGCPPET